MKIKSIKIKIKEYFLLNPTIRLRVRQIEREVKVPLPSVIRYAKELEQGKILKVTIIAGIKLYSTDRSSKTYLIEKRLFNLQSLYFSGLIDFLIEKYSNPTIIVFGSYSIGEDIEKSDIDIYIETPKKEIEKNLNSFEKKLQRNIQVFQHKNINQIKNKALINNIINGIVLNGFLEVV